MRRIDSNGRQELAIVVGVADSGPRGGKNLQLFFQTEKGNFNLSLPPTFSSRSKCGRIFQAVTGVRPTDCSRADPLKSVVGKQCRVVLAPRADGIGDRVVAVLPPPAPQLELVFEGVGG